MQSYDLVAVYRIGKFIQGKHRNVIVRFINRKNAFSCLKHSSKLAKSGITEYRKLFITEKCPANKQIFNYLYKLKKTGTINNVWTFSGEVFFRKSESQDDSSQKVAHIVDVDVYLEYNSDSN